jgi:phosphoenolpyruvate---glycerone phosphotransferase subunit DhaL
MPSRADAKQAFAAAIAAVQVRGKSEPGQKTMLDVLVPVQCALAGDRPLRDVAAAAAAATVPMKASRGRASFLGDRSIGHMDPGARSSQILIGAVLDVLEGKV